MKQHSALKLIKGIVVLALVVTVQSIYAGKSTKWQQRFIQSTQEGTTATATSIPGDGLSCMVGSLQVNRNLADQGVSTDLVTLNPPVMKSGAAPYVLRCASFSPKFYNSATGREMNSGNVSLTCLNGNISIATSCRVVDNQPCPFANGWGSNKFDPAIDDYTGCTLDGCNGGYTPFNNSCWANQVGCYVPNGSGVQNYAGNGAYTGCILTGCNGGFTGWNNACYQSTVGCSIANGSGEQYFSNGGYSACTVTGCNAGYVQSGNACIIYYPDPPPTGGDGGDGGDGGGE